MLSTHRTQATPLVVVSHRLPVTYDEASAAFVASPGGLATAVSSGLEDQRALWLGHHRRFDPLPPRTHADFAGVQMGAIRLHAADFELAITGYANRTLWPALHGLTNHVEHDPAWWEQYRELSETIAQAVAHAAEHRATVWLQDFHHFGVCEPLRRMRPDIRLLLFCHTPVDAAIAKLPNGDQLRTSLRTCERIGVQRARDADALRDWLDDDRVEVVVAPVGIDHVRWERMRQDPTVRAAARSTRPASGVHLVGVDRMDYTKGVSHRLLAIEYLLGGGLVQPDDLRLTQVATPTRVGVPFYRHLEKQIAELTRRINTEFKRSDGLPVVDLRTVQHDPKSIAALLRSGDVGLVNAVRDGFNLVAAQFSLVNADRPAALVLGRGAGIHDVIGGVSQGVDGDDVLDVAGAIRSALGMGASTAARRSARRADLLKPLTPSNWVRLCLGEVSEPVTTMYRSSS